MSNSTVNYAARIAAVRKIGAGERALDNLKEPIVEAIRATGDDHTARGYVAAFVATYICGDGPEEVQRGKNGDYTDYGRGKDRLVNQIKRLLSEPAGKPEAVTVTYRDADGQTAAVTITPDHKAFSALVALTASN